MSTHIEFEQVAVRLTADQVGSGLYRDDYLVLMVCGGDNNCIGPDGRIHRAWYIMGYGEHYSVIRQVVHRAADCESGMLRMDSLSHSARPEAYIKRWRQRLASAWSLDDAFAAGFHFSLRLELDAARIDTVQATAHGRDRLQRLTALRPPFEVPNGAFGSAGTCQRHAFSVTDPEQMALFNEMHDLGLGPWSRKVHLHTPKPARSNPASLTPKRAGIGPVSAAKQPV